ncbi:hypothetical protein BDZ91DRAFT_722261 [Kalaharituber pfeilii]|nr:hypothetical protein BDZ91DRAFT_722261 [Kalaharituber pfeilii]
MPSPPGGIACSAKTRRRLSSPTKKPPSSTSVFSPSPPSNTKLSLAPHTTSPQGRATPSPYSCSTRARSTSTIWTTPAAGLFSGSTRRGTGLSALRRSLGNILRVVVMGIGFRRFGSQESGTGMG